MAIGSIKTTNGKKISLYRSYTETADLSATEYLAETQYLVGINNGTPNIINNDLTLKVPIGNGTVNDNGANTFTGSNGGKDSTDNIVIYKEGAGASDVTAQNLLTTGSNVTKTWTIADLTVAGANADAAKYTGLWVYILDTATLTKISAFEVRIGADSTANYYSKDWFSSLAVGWNWLCNNAILSTWTAVGTPGTLNDFQINITAGADDAFIAGDIVVDLLRQWTAADFVKDFQAGYPSLDFTKLEATQRGYLVSTEANGFDLDGVGTANEDTSKLMGSESTHTSLSKSLTDEMAYIMVDRYI